MLATPRDEVRFLTALFDGAILGLTYGELLVKGHLGLIPGHTSVMGRDEHSGVTAILIQNSGAADFESFYLTGIHEPFAAVLRETRRLAR